MKKYIILLAIFIITRTILIHTGYSLTKSDVKGFVEEAYKFAVESGKEKALKEFSQKEGPFKRGELYIFAYDYKGVIVAHGADPDLIGKNFFLIQDKNGKLLIQEMIKAVRDKGEGWVEYMWRNPKNGKYMKKHSFVKKIDDTYWIGAGIYIEE